MGNQDRPFPYLIRAAILLVCLAGGFVFPPLFAGAALVAWGLYSDLTAPKQQTSVTRWTVSPADPDWKGYFLRACDSPAETAFLEAIIRAYDLKPDKGMLKGGSLTLDLQHGVGPHTPFPKYRLDFLANGWLDIEIDGAEFHSSEEAIAQDKARDEFMRARGCDVLRVPAKVVFTSPQEAVRQVREKIASGKTGGIASPAKSESRPAQEIRPAEAMRSTISSIGKGVEAIGGMAKCSDAQ